MKGFNLFYIYKMEVPNKTDVILNFKSITLNSKFDLAKFLFKNFYISI